MGSCRLDISVVGECDSILLIKTGHANRHYDGWPDAWVGTHDGEYCNARMTMRTARR